MSNTRKKQIAIGVEDFKEIIDKGAYFVDKTLMIKKLIESNAMVTLFTRPRRFGKTLNQFMIRRFFEDERTEKGEKVDNGGLFDGLAITQCGEEILSHQQQYPVIFLSLKSAKQPNFQEAYKKICRGIAEEFRRHQYLLEGKSLADDQKILFKKIMTEQADYGEYNDALKFLSECLWQYHGKNTIILIDEYDVPLENAYFRGFYDEMIDFIRSLFESALKTNPYLEKSVITGCLRISKESIFTGRNNLETDSVLHARYSEAFGFTEEEVKSLCNQYGRDFTEVKRWYNGYLLNNYQVYNPKAVVESLRWNQYKSYWSQTGTYEAIVPLINMNFDGLKTAIIEMLSGASVEVDVSSFQNDMTSFSNKDDVLTYLIHLGYLAYNQTTETAFIPNEEIRQELIKATKRKKWDELVAFQRESVELLDATLDMDCELVENTIEKIHMEYVSMIQYNDENSLSSVLAIGYLSAMQYYFKPIRELPSGRGFADFVFIPKLEYAMDYPALIVELKWNKNVETAIEQIRTKKYPASIEQYTGEILLVGTNYDKKTKKHQCKIEKYSK